MNKNDFRCLCNNLSSGDSLVISAMDTAANSSAKVNYVKIGRGRGGSRLLSVELESGGTRLYSSKYSNQITSVRHNDVVYGNPTPRTIVLGPSQGPTNVSREIANNVNGFFKRALAAFNTGEAVYVSFPHISGNMLLHGNWKVTSGRLVRGRNGQVALNLQNDSGQSVEVWSRRILGEVVNISYMLENGFTEQVNCL